MQTKCTCKGQRKYCDCILINRDFPLYEAVMDDNFQYVPGKEIDWPENVWAVERANYKLIPPAFSLFDILLSAEESIRVLANAKIFKIHPERPLNKIQPGPSPAKRVGT